MDYTINVLVIVNLILCLYFTYISCNLLIEKFDAITTENLVSHNHYSSNVGCGGVECGQTLEPVIPGPSIPGPSIPESLPCVEYNGWCGINSNCCGLYTCTDNFTDVTGLGATSQNWRKCL